MPPALKCESPGLFMRERRSKKNTKKGSFFCWRKLQCVSRILREEEVYERGAAPTKIKISQKVAQFLAPQKRPKSPPPPSFAHCNTHISPKDWNQIRSPKSYLYSPQAGPMKSLSCCWPPPHVLTWTLDRSFITSVSNTLHRQNTI